MQIGFIGLGSMGAPIARRLAQVGHSVVGCDVSAAAMAALDEPGTRCDTDPIVVARDAEILGICVRTDAQLETLCEGDAIFAALGDGGIFIINSTVAPDLARRLAERAAAHGVGLIDVGVSGGGPKAAEGKLSLFVGGGGGRSPPRTALSRCARHGRASWARRSRPGGQAAQQSGFDRLLWHGGVDPRSGCCAQFRS